MRLINNNETFLNLSPGGRNIIVHRMKTYYEISDSIVPLLTTLSIYPTNKYIKQESKKYLLVILKLINYKNNVNPASVRDYSNVWKDCKYLLHKSKTEFLNEIICFVVVLKRNKYIKQDVLNYCFSRIEDSKKIQSSYI